jgi:hypothetical protein
MSIYWADVLHELAFLVPSSGLDEDGSTVPEPNASASGSLSASGLDKKSLSNYSDETASSTASRNFSDSGSLKTQNKRKRVKQYSLHANIGCDIKVLIIWLENWEDELGLPIGWFNLTVNFLLLLLTCLFPFRNLQTLC